MTKQTQHYFKSNFSEYIRNNCLDSKLGLVVCDVDYIVRDYNKKLVMVVEEKTNNDYIPFAEKETLKLIGNSLQHNTLGYKYLGTYLIRVGNFIESDPIYIGLVTNQDEVEMKQVLPDTLVRFINFQMFWNDIK